MDDQAENKLPFLLSKLPDRNMMQPPSNNVEKNNERRHYHSVFRRLEYPKRPI